MHSKELFIGLMSGTSIDGIDAALVSFESANQLTVIETLYTEYEKSTRDQINFVAQNNKNLRRNEDSDLHLTLAPLYASACENLMRKAKVSSALVSGIANHGQTVKHEPRATPPYSLQLGDGQTLANLTGIKTITQFRQADLAVGGQGAPLMPAFHNAVFSQQPNSIILNIGGIANITCLGTPVIGFDTGPGNVLLDQWVEQHFGFSYDKNGALAKQGKVNPGLLEALLEDPYFSTPQPKSTGTDHFNLAWVASKYPSIKRLSVEDVQATFLELSVKTICDAIKQMEYTNGAVFVCGGGANNPLIMDGLSKHLADFDIAKTDALGVPSDWVEAVGFAWLGYCHVHGINSNIPTVTGAKEDVVLGEAYLPR